MSVSEKPGTEAKSRDELLKQVKELNKTLALSEEAVSIKRYKHKCTKTSRFIKTFKAIVHDTYKTAKINFINSGPWI